MAGMVSTGQVWQVEGLLLLAQQSVPNLTVVVYSLDLSPLELQQLEDTCNTSCAVVTFDFNAYPSHVKDLRLKAYRPIIIQELLVHAGAVLWLDASVRLEDETQDADRATEWNEMALKSGGVLTWPLPSPALLPSAALTHPNMFTFFHTKKHNYDFQQMGDAGTMMVYNTEAVHYHLMKPWVSCALTHNCINPIGAQDTGCRYDKKPLFRYSGCHHYDASAFNVALGVMFSYDTRPYLAASSPFTRVSRKAQQEVDNMQGEEGTNTSIKDNSVRKYSGKRTEKTVSLNSSHSVPSFRLSHQNIMPSTGSKVIIQNNVKMVRDTDSENDRREAAAAPYSAHSGAVIVDEGTH
ncbi:uncharacterized protein [Panulirus ornatus]|uniref:uncharacterized protein n=1 Tax=Panulirus ornatus TaxID=150431 RepID=UPI003A859725